MADSTMAQSKDYGTVFRVTLESVFGDSLTPCRLKFRSPTYQAAAPFN